MDYSEENSNMQVSRMRPPSNIGSPGKLGLSEMTQSDNNVRTQSKMPQPRPIKHKLAAPVTESVAQRRKVFPQRGEDPYPRSNMPPPQTAQSITGGMSLADAGKRAGSSATYTSSSRTASSASSVSSMSGLPSSKPDFSKSVGPGHGHTKSLYSARGGQLSKTFSQSTRNRPAPNGSRPRSASGTRNQVASTASKQVAKEEWNEEAKRGQLEGVYADFLKMTKSNFDDSITTIQKRNIELEIAKQQLETSNSILTKELDATREKAQTLEGKLMTTTISLATSLDEQARASKIEIDDLNRSHRYELDDIRRERLAEEERQLRSHRDETHELKRQAAMELQDKILEIEKNLESKLEEERSRRIREVEELEAQIQRGGQTQLVELENKTLELQIIQGALEDAKAGLQREQALKAEAQRSLSGLEEKMRTMGLETSTTIMSLQSEVQSQSAKIHFLESGSREQSDRYAEMEASLREAQESAASSKTKLMKEETLRRSLFNQVQELKGNIRVMCRVRPAPSNDAEGQVAQIKYPDVDKESKEVELLGKEEKSSLGNVTRKKYPFTFDRVFGPECQNEEIFGEISQLVQSALDGYNVCIFCYGQTGSGKTHTMSSADGMIPRATRQIYESASNAKEKGWSYTMEGNFVEVYNEEIHDLLGSSKDFDRKKHEIRHNDKQTIVTGLETVPLTSANTVEKILDSAAKNRSVAATKSNERSSRSHSVFILKLVGKNSTTNETSEGILNLVDLAGSERLKSSGAEGERMKETQNINKSLSCLGDVIGALGQGKEGAHIPYRNSKLTYLLQNSLGGNSKTLMFVMASPLEAHLTETLTSLKFATKVHNTHIGTAKKSRRSND
ncbi:P-loop containing nucleoside triphosphate hydrolase protein [Amylocarpus encephaloides]|uniref:P-loop containing nucleoside triphosphate hydrolase protein n=1 Tax=Amylocarpus encephaloides TaxID=45428 RepID=A0A9P7YGE6_9HELO|nr:P-loop containing nucleoside triphosphate hydrolase protein [Amylocarpus encephaloides]